MESKRDVIAVVGMACRFPRDLDSIDRLWNGLLNKYNACGPVPPDRWDGQKYVSDNDASKGKTRIKTGNFLDQDIAGFDAAFFGISPRDAENMDPQQRILLELVWEAFENAGLPPRDYAKRNVGVYIGGFMLDHMITQMAQPNRSQINQNTAAGMMMTMLSNRLSHVFDFRGPSLSIDTACSSSLTAFHYGCQDVWNGACEIAVVGGINVMSRPEYPIGMSKGHFLSPDGQCKSFDERADGYGRGEGGGIVLLKPLQKAIKDGDTVLATVIGTGANQDGHTAGISMPNGEAQEALIREVWSRYDIKPSDVRYVECHGTGTAIGDPTECGAIGATYGEERRKNNLGPVVVGSIKSNIGHLEAAAGIAGVIKSVLTLQHRKAAPLGNLQTPNPNIPFEDLGVRISDTEIPLASAHESFSIAINSFGYGGTNAHAILQSAPSNESSNQLPDGASSKVAERNGKDPAVSISGVVSQSQKCPAGDEFPLMIPLSATSKEALKEVAVNYLSTLKETENWEDVLHTAALRRSHLEERAVAAGFTKEELIQSLRSIADGSESERIAKGSRPYQGKEQPVFVFTGMGPQWWAMGQELYQSSPVYKETVEQADAIFKEVSGFSILAEMLKTEQDSQITKTELAQPANLVLQLGVYKMMLAAGVKPGAVVGHSVGELGAAYASGILSLKDCITVSYHRSKLQATAAGLGGMLAVGLGKSEIKKWITGKEDKVDIAAVNSPTTVTLAGDIAVLANLEKQLTEQDIFARTLEVEVPYHSHLMDPLMEPLKHALRDIQTNSPTIPVYSTVTTDLATEKDFGSDYWPKNIRQSVEFSETIQKILDDGYNTFVEIGPHPVLSASLRDCIKNANVDARLVHTLRRKKPELNKMHHAVMGVHCAGCQIEWKNLVPTGKLTTLPNYPWQREEFWLENDRAKLIRIATIDHPMLGNQEALAAAVWRNDVDHQSVNYLRDHVVSGLPVLPAAAYLETLLELASIQFPNSQGLVIRDLEIDAPMVISPDRGADYTTTYDSKHQTATIRSLENGRLGYGQIHVTAKIGSQELQVNEKNLRLSVPLNELKKQFQSSVPIESFYRQLNEIGLSYGSSFQTVQELSMNSSGDEMLCRVALKDECQENSEKYLLHPTLLDGCFHSLMAMLDTSTHTYLPRSVAELALYQEKLPSEFYCVGKRVKQTAKYIETDLQFFDLQGVELGYLKGLATTATKRNGRTDQFGDSCKLQVLDYLWHQGAELSEPKRLGHWLVVGKDGEEKDYVTNRLESFGAIVVGDIKFSSQFGQNGRQFEVRPDQMEDFRQILQQCGSLDGVVFLTGQEAESTDDVTGVKTISKLIQLTKNLLKEKEEFIPRVYVVTTAAFSVDNQDPKVVPSQSAINGFVRVASNELEGFRFTTIDLPTEIDEQSLELLALELVCDGDEDEIAIRGETRLVSQLDEVDWLTSDRLEQERLDDYRPIAIRPLRPDQESTGSVRLVEVDIPKPQDGELLLKIESVLTPPELISDQAADRIQRPFVEVVGRVLEDKSNNPRFQNGTRVCGFAPADLLSHQCAVVEAFHLVEIPDHVPAKELLGSVADASRAIFAIEASRATSGDQVLVDWREPIASFLVAEFIRNDVEVTVLIDEGVSLDKEVQDRCEIIPRCSFQLRKVSTEKEGFSGFDLIAANFSDFVSNFGLIHLKTGGIIIDCNEEVGQSISSPKVGTLIRTDLEMITGQAKRFSQALEQAVDRLIHQELPAIRTLDVSVADISLQVLPLGDTSIPVVISFDVGSGSLPIVQVDKLNLEENGSYLITGGFGGFGMKTATWLADHGAGRIILTGRRGADTVEKQNFIQKLQKQGCEVEAVACDVSDLEATKNLVNEIQQSSKKLKGVFHSAAVIIDEPIEEIELDHFEKVMAAKAAGAWNLHLATADVDLDHFVMYSSLANMVGNSRQSAYCSANGFLNGLAKMRNKQGLPAMSANWGAISDVGIVTRDEKLEQFLKHVGLRGIPSAEALDLLEVAMVRNVNLFGLVLITSWADWSRFETLGAKSFRFAKMIEADAGTQDSAFLDELKAELEGMPYGDRLEVLAGLMQEITADVLKADPQDVSIDRPVNELGIDSLMAVEIQLNFDGNFGFKVSVLELLGEVTLRSLAAKALEQLFGTTSDTVTSSPSEKESLEVQKTV